MVQRRVLIALLALFWLAKCPCFGVGEATNLRSFPFGPRSISYEELDGEPGGPVAILLPGTSGPGAQYYQERAKILRKSGSTVLILHYFDAAQTEMPSDANYEAWVGAVQRLIAKCKSDPKFSTRKTVLVGYSLGASIALAAGSQMVPVNAIAEWYGSLPDVFFHKLKGMPPLLILHGAEDANIPVVNARQLVKLCDLAHFECESHIYPNQAHGFSGSDLADADARTVAFFHKTLR